MELDVCAMVTEAYRFFMAYKDIGATQAWENLSEDMSAIRDRYQTKECDELLKALWDCLYLMATPATPPQGGEEG